MVFNNSNIYFQKNLPYTSSNYSSLKFLGQTKTNSHQYAQFEGWGGEMEGVNCFHCFFLCSQHVPFKFPMGSHQVLNVFSKFPMCSSRVFPIAPFFNPICFAQSPPLLTYIVWAKGEGTPSFHKIFYLGKSP